MKKSSKILLLLPFLSIAMPAKNAPGAANALVQASTQLEIGTISFDIMTLVSEFSTKSTAKKIKYIHSSYFLDINNTIQLEKISEIRVNSSEACGDMVALANAVRLRPTETCFPDYISFFGPLPKIVKETLTNLVKEGKYNRSIYCGQFGTRIEIPVVENMFDEPKSENYWQNLLRLGCVQDIVKKVNFRKDLSEDAMISIAKKMVSKFEYITKKMVTEGTEESRRFKSELAEKIQKNICFIVRKDCIDDYKINFKKLCGDNLAKMQIITLVEKETDIAWASSIDSALLNIYTLKPFTIHDICKLQKFQLLNWPSPQIGDKFLSGCRQLTSLDLSAFSHVTQIGNDFLSGCKELTSIDLSSLSQVTQIGAGFLSGCKLTNLDLSSLNQVTQIGNDFLSGCLGLTNINLSSLNQVTQIRDNFLSGCRGLTSIDLKSLSQITKIGEGFLLCCSGLTSIDLSPLKQITQIEKYFLFGGDKLKIIDLSPLSHVIKIGDEFLGIGGLTSIDLSSLNQVTQIGNNFLVGSMCLVVIDLSSLSQVTQIGNGFLEGCTSLVDVDLSPLNQVTTIGNKWLEGGCRLRKLNLSKLEHVTQIGSDFLKNCSLLKKENVNTGTLPADHPVIRAVDKALGKQK